MQDGEDVPGVDGLEQPARFGGRNGHHLDPSTLCFLPHFRHDGEPSARTGSDDELGRRPGDIFADGERRVPVPAPELPRGFLAAGSNPAALDHDVVVELRAFHHDRPEPGVGKIHTGTIRAGPATTRVRWTASVDGSRQGSDE